MESDTDSLKTFTEEHAHIVALLRGSLFTCHRCSESSLDVFMPQLVKKTGSTPLTHPFREESACSTQCQQQSVAERGRRQLLWQALTSGSSRAGSRCRAAAAIVAAPAAAVASPATVPAAPQKAPACTETGGPPWDMKQECCGRRMLTPGPHQGRLCHIAYCTLPPEDILDVLQGVFRTCDAMPLNWCLLVCMT